MALLKKNLNIIATAIENKYRGKFCRGAEYHIKVLPNPGGGGGGAMKQSWNFSTFGHFSYFIEILAFLKLYEMKWYFLVKSKCLNTFMDSKLVVAYFCISFHYPTILAIWKVPGLLHCAPPTPPLYIVYWALCYQDWKASEFFRRDSEDHSVTVSSRACLTVRMFS